MTDIVTAVEASVKPVEVVARSWLRSLISANPMTSVVVSVALAAIAAFVLVVTL